MNAAASKVMLAKMKLKQLRACPNLGAACLLSR
jgi:hypothetical protein